MRLSNKILSVIVNPFAAPLLSDGRACVVVACDPTEPSAAKYLGVRTKSVKQQRKPGTPFGDKSVMVVESYKLEPIKLHDTEYYRLKLKSGELLYAEGAIERLANLAYAVIDANKLDRDKVFAVWEKQGLGAIVAMLRPKPRRKRTDEIAGETRAEGAVS